MNLTVRVRLTLFYVTLLAAVLCALAVFLVVRLNGDLRSGLDRTLDASAAGITQGYENGEDESIDPGDGTLTDLVGRDAGAQVVSPSGKVLRRGGVAGAKAPVLGHISRSRAMDGKHVRRSVKIGSDNYRVFAERLSTRHGPRVLIVMASEEAVKSSVQRLIELLLFAVPGGLLLTALGGWLLAHRALLPVARMTEQADAIGVEHLHERVSVPKVDDELAGLARTLNHMLERLERGVEDQRRFVSDASHELRTPLAVMRSELEVALRGPRLAPEARDVLASSVDEVDRMSHLVDNLLTLARIDEGELKLLHEDLDLTALVTEVMETNRAVASSKHVGVVMDGFQVNVSGDRPRLRQVFSNIVDNALKYAGDGGEVRVDVRLGDKEAVVAISDTGPGIPEHAVAHIFDRFYRVDAARTRADGGSGLGLAICKEIVQAHGGRLWAESVFGEGATFSVALPTSDLSQPSHRPTSTVPSHD